MAKQPENKFKDKIIRDLLKLPSMWIFKTQERARHGIPDIILCFGGNFIAIEAKTNDAKGHNRQEALQQITINDIIKAGGMGFITTPDEWPVHYNLLVSMITSERE